MAGALISDHMVFWGKLLGMVFGGIGAVCWTQFLAERVGCRFSIVAVAIGALLPMVGAERTVTGMETGLICALTGAFVLAVSRRSSPWLIGLISGLLLLTRLELGIAPLVVVAFALARRHLGESLKATLAAALVAVWWPLWLFVRTGRFLPPTRTGKLSVFLPEQLGITIGQFESSGLADRLQWALSATAQFAGRAVSHMAMIAVALAALSVVLLAWRRLDNSARVAVSVPFVWMGFSLVLYSFAFPLLQLRYFVWLVPGVVAAGVYSASLIMSRRMFSWIMTGALAVLLAIYVRNLQHRRAAIEVQQIRRDLAEVTKQLTPARARIALEPIGEFKYYSDRYVVDMGGLVSMDTPLYLRGGFADTEAIWACMRDLEADYLITYDHDGFLGRVIVAYPGRFKLVTTIPASEESPVRYRLMKIIAP